MNPDEIRDRCFPVFWEPYKKDHVRSGADSKTGKPFTSHSSIRISDMTATELYREYEIDDAPVGDPKFRDDFLRQMGHWDVIPRMNLDTRKKENVFVADQMTRFGELYRLVTSGIFNRMPAWICAVCQAENDYPIPVYPLTAPLKLQVCKQCGRKSVETKLQFLSFRCRGESEKFLELVGVTKLSEKKYVVL